VNKKCSSCKKILDVSRFNWKFRNIKRATYCKICSRKYIKAHYHQNRKYYLEKAKKRNIIVRKLIHEYIDSYLKNHPCVDCGESNTIVLEFDHIKKDTKDDNVASIMKRQLTLRKLEAEVLKCEVRCANCHRIKTAKENNNWKLTMHP